MLAQSLAAVALLVLAASGLSKLWDPAPTVGALASAGLPSGKLTARILGLAELAISTVALSVGGHSLWMAAVLYAGFALFVVMALRGNFALQSCGCFGRDDTPPTILHVVFNTVSAISLGYVAANSLGPIPDGSFAEMALFIGFAAIGAYLSFLLLSRLPALDLAT